jgi:hypothetical protein
MLNLILMVIYVLIMELFAFQELLMILIGESWNCMANYTKLSLWLFRKPGIPKSLFSGVYFLHTDLVTLFKNLTLQIIFLQIILHYVFMLNAMRIFQIKDQINQIHKLYLDKQAIMAILGKKRSLNYQK